MKNIFLKILVSILIVFLVLFGLSSLYEFGLKHNNNLKASFVQKEKINADIIIHGPCEPLWIVSPAILDKNTGLKSYNLALSHSDFADNYLHLYFYLKNNAAPKYLFLYVTSESMDINFNTFNTYRFAAYTDDTIVKNVLKDCDTAYSKWINFPFMKYSYYNNRITFDVLQGYKHYFTNRTLPYYPDGYEPPIKVVWDNHLEKFIKLYPDGYTFKWNLLREKYLRQTIELAQRNHIKVYLYESPVLKESLSILKNREEIISRIKTIADEYKIKYVQFNEMNIAESRRYYMSDLTLNMEGARIFTDSLGLYIKGEIGKE